MMFFAYNRGGQELEKDLIRPYPLQSIYYIVFEQSAKSEIYRNIIGNIVCFVPYGFLGILYPKLNQYKNLFLTFFISINYLEFCQYFFKRGYAELDDVILNSLGMTIGFLIFKKFFQKNK